MEAHHIVPSLAIFSLVMAFISFWIYRHSVVWGSFVVIALALGYFGKLLSPVAFLPIVLLFFAHLILTTNVSGFTRMVTVLVATIISFGLLFHIMPGFDNWQIIKQVTLTKGAYPYSLDLNFDKPFIGLFVLAFTPHLISSLKDLDLKRLLTYCILGIVLLFCVAYYLGIFRFDLKIPSFTPLWLATNMFLVVIPEEAFFRGFLQREITEALRNKYGAVLAIILVSLSYAIVHLPFVDSYAFVISSFVAGAIYGTIYHLTSRVESAIICHFLVNVIHFFFFTFPAIQS